jgi:flagellar biosynthesis/type III secretory pathway M-ring protein FliF/YscJ
MKNILKVALVAAGIFTFAQSQAQNTHKDSTVGHKITKTATKVGHKTAEIAANSAAMVVDKKYKGKCGPDGQTVYINKHAHYYYINKRGHRVYLKRSQLRNAPKED